MLFAPDTAAAVALAAAAVAAVAIAAATSAVVRLGHIRRAYAAVAGVTDAQDVLTELARRADDVSALQRQVGQLERQLRTARTDLSDAVRHVAVVRYDAFADLGGRMSFSAALLDDAGDGLVLTSINGRSESRAYAKGVKGGGGDQPLSPEEEQAVGAALGNTGN